MKLFSISELMDALLEMFPNDPRSSTKDEAYMEESVWVGDVIHALETGTLPFRKRNGSQIKYTASLEEQASFRQQLDAQFSNLYVNAHDAFEWLKGFRRDADAFAAKYCVDDATLPVASKQTAPVETPAPATGGTLAASAAPISRKNKSEKTLKLETTVLRLVGCRVTGSNNNRCRSKGNRQDIDHAGGTILYVD